MSYLQRLFELARLHQGKNESAAICIQDAESCLKTEWADYAKHRLLKSLCYSVGIFHEDYTEAETIVKFMEDAN